MEEPSCPPPMTSQSLIVAPPPPSPPPSPPTTSQFLSITLSPPYLSHSPSLLIASLPPLHSQPTPSTNINPDRQHDHCDYDEFILHNGKNFGWSQVPVKIMFYLNKCWQDFKDEVLESLRYGFASGKTIVPLKIEGSMYAFDFLRMLQVHIDSKVHRSIAWIDENGKPFFPARFIDRDFSKVVAINDFNKKDKSKQKSLAPASKFPNAKLLSKSDQTYAYINNLFMNNVANHDPHAIVTSIHEFQISNPRGRDRWDAFEKQIEMTEVARGKANVVYGWYAAPAEKVATIFSDGFELCPIYPTMRLRPSIGAGIFLADLESPQHCGMQYQVDKDEEKHLILCRVVLGSVERVDLESHQVNSSNKGYDTGSNDPKNPKWYVVWANDINKRILPVCVVSCKTSIVAAVKWEMLPIELTRVPRVVLEFKKQIPIEFIPPLQDIYDSFKTDITEVDLFKKRMQVLLSAQRTP